MALKIEKFNHLRRRILDGTFDFDAGDLKVMLVTSAYAFSANHTVLADVSGSEVNGTGYTAGGAAMANAAVTHVDDAAATAWATGTPYAFGDIRRPTAANGHVYMCIVPGTSDGVTEPTWPTTDNGTVDDNGVIWLEIGDGYARLDADDVEWANITITARRAIVYRNDTVNSLVKPLAFSILLDDSPADVSSTNSNFTLQWAAAGILVL